MSEEKRRLGVWIIAVLGTGLLAAFFMFGAGAFAADAALIGR